MMNDAYPTRHGGEPALLPRRDPVLYGPSRPGGPLTAAEATAYRDRGFLLLGSRFSDAEIAALEVELERLRADRGVRALPESITEPGSGALRSLFAPHRHSAIIAALARDPRLLDIAEHLLGGPVYLHQARVNYKLGLSGAPFYWHSDFETWHAEDGLPRMRTLSISVALTENTVVNGPLMLLPGSHLSFVSCPEQTPPNHFERSLKNQLVGTPDAASLSKLSARGIALATGRAGTLTVFDSNTMHASAGNLSPWPRLNVFFVYNSVENGPAEPFSGRPPRPWFVAERRDLGPLECRRADLVSARRAEASS